MEEERPLTDMPLEPYYTGIRDHNRYYCPLCGTVRQAFDTNEGFRVPLHYVANLDAASADGRWAKCRGGPVDPTGDRAP